MAEFISLSEPSKTSLPPPFTSWLVSFTAPKVSESDLKLADTSELSWPPCSNLVSPRLTPSPPLPPLLPPAALSSRFAKFSPFKRAFCIAATSLSELRSLFKFRVSPSFSSNSLPSFDAIVTFAPFALTTSPSYKLSPATTTLSLPFLSITTTSLEPRMFLITPTLTAIAASFKINLTHYKYFL